MIPCARFIALTLLGLSLCLTGCTRSRGGAPYPLLEGPPPSSGSLAGPVWLIGIDGASWEVMRPLLDRGELASFRGLIERGAWGTLLSEEPMISPALWATIATGVPREVHGIANFMVRVPGSYRVVEAGPLDRRAPAVWDLVGAAGGRSAVMNWFGSFPAEEIAGAYVSKGLDPEQPRPRQLHPPDLAEVLRREARVQVPPAAARQIARTPYLRNTLLEDARTMAVLEVLSREPADFVAAYFSGVDVVQHVTWKHMDPAYVPFPGEGPRQPELADVIPAYYRYVDHLLGRVVSLAPENATLMIVSDHGGGPMEPEQAFHFQLEVLLRRLGYMVMSETDPETVDWPRTTAFTISELYRDNKRIWLNLDGVEEQGRVPVGEADATAREVSRRLRRLRTDSGEPVFDSVEVHTGRPSWSPGDPALTVRFSGDALVASTASDGGDTFDMSAVRLRHADVSGGHRLEGIFLLAGPEIKPGALSRPVRLHQVAPTLLYLLGLPQDGWMLGHAPAGGGVVEEVVLPETLSSRPVQMVSRYSGLAPRPRRGHANLPGQDPAEEKALQTLRSLGYLR